VEIGRRRLRRLRWDGVAVGLVCKPAPRPGAGPPGRGAVARAVPPCRPIAGRIRHAGRVVSAMAAGQLRWHHAGPGRSASGRAPLRPVGGRARPATFPSCACWCCWKPAPTPSSARSGSFAATFPSTPLFPLTADDGWRRPSGSTSPASQPTAVGGGRHRPPTVKRKMSNYPPIPRPAILATPANPQVCRVWSHRMSLNGIGANRRTVRPCPQP